MSQRVFNTSPTPEIRIIRVAGNLTVKGWDNDEITVKGSADDRVEFDQTADSLSLTCDGDCLMRVPVGSSLTIDKVDGEAHFKLLEEPIRLDRVAGNLIASYIAGMNVSQVNGELIVKHLSGDLQADIMEGNAIIKDVQGQVRLNRVEGNLDARAVEGSLYARVDGNARLRLPSLDGAEVQVSADGNLDCRISDNSSAQVSLSSASGRIHVSGPEGNLTIEDGNHSLTLGDGEAQVNLSAEGNLQFSILEEGWNEEAFDAQLSDQIGRQVEEHMQALQRQLEEQMSHLSSLASQPGMNPERMEQIMKRARETSERAAARAQEKMRRAQEKIERKMEQAQRKAEARARAAARRSTRSWSVNFGSSTSSGAAPEPVDPVSEEERLLILRMLEEKKITLDEAERLLAALEGKEE